MKEYVENVLAPKLQADGGWVEFVCQEGQTLRLIFRGECSKCMVLERCVGWMEDQILQSLNQRVRIEAVRKKPFFWDKN